VETGRGTALTHGFGVVCRDDLLAVESRTLSRLLADHKIGMDGIQEFARAATLRPSITGQTMISIDCRRWRPISALSMGATHAASLMRCVTWHAGKMLEARKWVAELVKLLKLHDLVP
jgi:hypothetical protein